MEDISSAAKRTTSERRGSGSSPTEKKPKQFEEDLERRENLRGAGYLELNKQDELARTRCMADEVQTKLNEILTKLQKLEIIETTLKDLSGRLAKEESVETKINGSIGFIVDDEGDCEDAKWNGREEQANGKPARETPLFGVIQPKRKFEFFGITKREMRASEEAEAADRHKGPQFMKFTENVIGSEDSCRNIEIQRVHRVGKLVAGKPRPIYARFLHFTDWERVLTGAKSIL